MNKIPPVISTGTFFFATLSTYTYLSIKENWQCGQHPQRLKDSILVPHFKGTFSET